MYQNNNIKFYKYNNQSSLKAKDSNTVIPFQNAQFMFRPKEFKMLISVICSFFVTQDLFHQSSTFSVSPARSQQRWLADCVQLYKMLPLTQARPQCWLSHSWYHAPHSGSIGWSAGMLGYRLWLHLSAAIFSNLLTNCQGSRSPFTMSTDQVIKMAFTIK